MALKCAKEVTIKRSHTARFPLHKVTEMKDRLAVVRVGFKEGWGVWEWLLTVQGKLEGNFCGDGQFWILIVAMVTQSTHTHRVHSEI